MDTLEQRDAREKVAGKRVRNGGVAVLKQRRLREHVQLNSGYEHV
jgi:hypothetical protein